MPHGFATTKSTHRLCTRPTLWSPMWDHKQICDRWTSSGHLVRKSTVDSWLAQLFKRLRVRWWDFATQNPFWLAWRAPTKMTNWSTGSRPTRRTCRTLHCAEKVSRVCLSPHRTHALRLDMVSLQSSSFAVKFNFAQVSSVLYTLIWWYTRLSVPLVAVGCWSCWHDADESGGIILEGVERSDPPPSRS